MRDQTDSRTLPLPLVIPGIEVTEFFGDPSTLVDVVPSVVRPEFPGRWGTECLRNGSGRAFWFVSRFVARHRVEYLLDALGQEVRFRSEAAALAAIEKVGEVSVA